MSSIHGHSTWDITRNCIRCKNRLKRITGECFPTMCSSGVGYMRSDGNYQYQDDMWGCDRFQSIKEKIK